MNRYEDDNSAEWSDEDDEDDENAENDDDEDDDHGSDDDGPPTTPPYRCLLCGFRFALGDSYLMGSFTVPRLSYQPPAAG